MGADLGAERRLSFAVRVWRLLRRIPAGQVATHGRTAAPAWRAGAARAVGRTMRQCPAHVPWHRVVRARLGGYRREAWRRGR